MGDGNQIFMFSFGPLSGLADIANGLPGTQFPSVFNTVAPSILLPGDPAVTDGMMANIWQTWPTANPTGAFIWNGAVGLAPDIANLVTIYDISKGTTGTAVYVQANAPLGLQPGQFVNICGTGTYTTAPQPPCGTGTAALNGYDGQY